MAEARVNLNIPQEFALKKALSVFKKQVETEGILRQLRDREFHKTKSQKNKLKSIAARTLLNKKDRKKEGKFNA